MTRLFYVLLGVFFASWWHTVLAAESSELNTWTRFDQPRGSPPMPAFENLAPKVGEQLPDLTIYDDSGNPVNIRELARGQYKVLILGCLT